MTVTNQKDEIFHFFFIIDFIGLSLWLDTQLNIAVNTWLALWHQHLHCLSLRGVA